MRFIPAGWRFAGAFWGWEAMWLVGKFGRFGCGWEQTL